MPGRDKDSPPAPGPAFRGLETPGRRAAIAAFAAHVQSGIRLELARVRSRPARPARLEEFTVYGDRRSGPAPPPPPRWPVYRLLCDERGRQCRLFDLETGRTIRAGTFYAGYVRMTGTGAVYLSPRPGIGLQGDSHPTIASRTPEWLLGRRAIVAGGELGIVEGLVVGHNDKTGHYQTRRNRLQSGLPADRFYPYTMDPKTWFREGGRR